MKKEDKDDGLFIECGIYKEEAEEMTAEEFADKHNSKVTLWGRI